MRDNVHWHCTTDYCIKLIFFDETKVKIAFISHQNDFCLIPLGNVLLGGQLQIDFSERPLNEIWEYALN